MSSYTIKEYHGTYNRTTRTATIKYIVIHYTGSGSSASGNALANCKYFAGGNRNASAHYFIDDANIYEYLDPSEYAAWHCGGGSGPVYNSNSIGIEVCASPYQTDPFTDEEISRLTWLTQKLMSEYSIDADHIVRHYDVTGKNCPYPYVKGSGSWSELLATISGTASSSTSTSTTVSDDGEGAVWRLYNSNTGDHMFSTGESETNKLIAAGWTYEGVGWYTPSSGTSVYRLYNPNATTGTHLWTTGTSERKTLVAAGWTDEGVAFYSGGSTPIHRLYNSNNGCHHYTASSSEYSSLVKAGWTDEGVAFYGSSVAQLDVDGVWGPLTTKALQTELSVTVDGEISYQYKKYQSTYLPAASTESWEFLDDPSAGYSPTIKGLQKIVSATQDGYAGPETVKCLQTWLNSTCSSGLVVDSVMGELTVKALQTALNDGTL